jgi:hypothetical protein
METVEIGILQDIRGKLNRGFYINNLVEISGNLENCLYQAIGRQLIF